jgi:hypothetical protein
MKHYIMLDIKIKIISYSIDMACISEKCKQFMNHYCNNKQYAHRVHFSQNSDATPGCLCRMDDRAFIELVNNGTYMGIG